MPAARTLAAASLLVVLVSAVPAEVRANTCLPGTGVAGDEFLVASAADLAKVGSGADGCGATDHYRQTADITLTGNWTPLTPVNPFSGVYDGGGHTISGLTVAGGSAFRGLFSRATSTAQFRDLTLAGVDVAGTSETGGLVGVLGGGTVTDVTVSGDVTGTGSWVAGIAGTANGGTLVRVRFTGTVTSTGTGTEIGGIVGELGTGTITDATVSATVTSAHRYTGGIAGSALGGTITRATFDGTVTVSGSTTEAGGITGALNNGTIVDSRATGTVSGPGGGFVGGVVGIVAPTSGAASISGSSFSGTVSSTGSSVGGIAGRTNATNGGTTITTSWSAGSVSGARVVGGLVGEMTRGSITASFSTAAVAVTDAAQTAPDLGGLVGVMMSGTVTDVFARGDLTNAGGAQDVGGLIGEMRNTSAPDSVLRRAYATGAVPGAHATVGGLAGGEGDVHSDAFWDTGTTGQATSVAGTGKTTAELTTFATFADTATAGLTTAWAIVDGWAPYVAGTTVWGICPRVNDGYPFLLWRYDSDPCTDPVVVAAPTIAITCSGPAGGALRAGAVADCRLTGGAPDVEILWRAAYNPTFAEGVVRTGTDGAGALSFTVPAAALGSVVTVEPVAWTAPIVVGTVEGGPVPTGIPAGTASAVVPGLAPGVVPAVVLVLAVVLMVHVRPAVRPAVRPVAGGSGGRAARGSPSAHA
jgi:hypothetical protein